MNARRLILTVLLMLFPVGTSGASTLFADDGLTGTGPESQVALILPGGPGDQYGATPADNPATDIDLPKPPKPPEAPKPLKPPEPPKPPKPPEPPKPPQQ